MPDYYRIFIFLIVLLTPFCLVPGQNPAFFENGTAYINPLNGPGYFKPFGEVLNNTFHAGLFPAADYDQEFYFYLGGNISYHFILENSRFFTGRTEESFEPSMQLDVPTIFGPDEPEILESRNGEYYIFPGGFSMDNLLLAVPQLSLGGIVNTDLTFRFLAVPLDDEWGDLNLIGFGLQHVISPYLHLQKVHLTIGAGYHRFKLGTWLESRNFVVRTSVVKAFKNSRIFGFVGYQDGELELVRTTTGEIVTSKSDHPFVLGGGASLDLAFLNVNFEVMVNSMVTANAGIGFKF